MTKMRCALLATACLLGLTTSQTAQAQVQFIDPTVNLQTGTINFDTNINPISGTLSEDAANIIRAERVALQQVQAAIMYLRTYRDQILAGQNKWYNQNFGDFYDPNSPFAGLYNRILKHDTGRLDQFNKPIYEDWYNTAHYDRVMFVFQRIQSALQGTINFAYGAQTGNAANAAIFTTYATNGGTQLTVGDPLFGSVTQPDNISQLLPYQLDPITGMPLIDPITMQPYAVKPLLGDPLVQHFALQLPTTMSRGLLQWGLSTSFTPAHLAQLTNNPGNPLHWADDNAISTQQAPLTPDQELAFFKDRLDVFGTQTTTAATATTPAVTENNLFVGGAFLNEQQRADSGGTGQPNQFFTPTQFNQYQQLIEALAQSAGSTNPAASGTGTTTTGTTASNIENGIFELLGSTANFYQALDGNSYASFADLFSADGIGDGTLLPPPGKQAGRQHIFTPLVPAS